MNFFKEERGTTTIEFALSFPLIFFICFFCILLLFRIGDGMILQYEASRLSRLESTGVTLQEEDTYYDDLVEIPSLNLFEEKATVNSLLQTGNLNMVETGVTASQAKIPPLLEALSLLEFGEGSDPEKYTVLRSSSIRIKEPYIP